MAQPSEDDDLANELLALAGQPLESDQLAPAAGAEGRDGKEQHPQQQKEGEPKQPQGEKKRSRGKKATYSDSDDENFSETSDELMNELQHKRKKGVGHDDEDEDNDGEDDTFENPYPLENKYIDVEDRAKLLALPEVEREQALYEREEEIQKLEEKRDLAQRLKEQRKRQVSALKSPNRRSGRGEIKTGMGGNKMSQLEKLKRRKTGLKSANAKRGAHRGEDNLSSELSEEEDDDDEEEEEGGEEMGRTNKGASNQITVADVNRIRLTRDQLASFAFHPLLEQSVQGCFARVAVSHDRKSGETMYRLCQVKGLVSHRPYRLEEKTVDQALEVAIGNSKRTFEMNIVSNSNVTEDDFNRYMKTLQEEHIRPSGKSLIERKYKDLTEMHDYQLRDGDITAMVEKRKSLQKIPGNLTLEKQRLRSRYKSLMDDGEFEQADAVSKELESLDALSSSQNASNAAHLEHLARMNERNRKRNIEEIRKAELTIIQDRRKATLAVQGNGVSGQTVVTSNPFSRLKTNPRTYYDSGQSGASSPIPTPSPNINPTAGENPADLKLDHSAPKKRSAVDSLIASADFEIDLDI